MPQFSFLVSELTIAPNVQHIASSLLLVLLLLSYQLRELPLVFQVNTRGGVHHSNDEQYYYLTVLDCSYQTVQDFFNVGHPIPLETQHGLRTH